MMEKSFKQKWKDIQKEIKNIVEWNVLHYGVDIYLIGFYVFRTYSNFISLNKDPKFRTIHKTEFFRINELKKMLVLLTE